MSWLTILGDDAAERALLCERSVEQRIGQGLFTRNDAAVVAEMKPGVLEGELHISAQSLERLRRLCQIWDVDLREKKFTSHRKYLGPWIVGTKRLFFPILRLFLSDTLRQQREFNAQVVTLLTEISNEVEKNSHPGR